MRIKEFTGKTTQEAIDNGLAELGVTIADVHVDVLQEGAKGLFGLFGSKPACVRLTVMEDEREDDHGLSDLLGSFSLNEQKKKSAPKPATSKLLAPRPISSSGVKQIQIFPCFTSGCRIRYSIAVMISAIPALSSAPSSVLPSVVTSV